MTVTRDEGQPAQPVIMLLSAAQAADSMDISERLLWSLTQSGEIPHVRIGRRVLYRPESLMAWVAGREQRGSSDDAVAV